MDFGHHLVQTMSIALAETMLVLHTEYHQAVNTPLLSVLKNGLHRK